MNRSDEGKWWVFLNGEVSNRPYSKDELSNLEFFDAETKVCPVGSKSWRKAADEAALAPIVSNDTQDKDNLRMPDNLEAGRKVSESRNRDDDNQDGNSTNNKTSWFPRLNWTHVGGFFLVMVVGSVAAVKLPRTIDQRKETKTTKQRPTSAPPTSNDVKAKTNYTVSPLFDEHYREKMSQLFKKANNRILVAMYLIESNGIMAGRRFPRHDDWVFKLLHDLDDAHDRGVTVKVILSRPKPDRDPRKTKANRLTKQWLEKRDMTVTFNDSVVEMHDKVVMVDNKWVVQGSHNWSPTGIGENREASLLMKADSGDTWSWNDYWRNLEKGRSPRR